MYALPPVHISDPNPLPRILARPSDGGYRVHGAFGPPCVRMCSGSMYGFACASMLAAGSRGNVDQKAAIPGSQPSWTSWTANGFTRVARAVGATKIN